MRAPYIFQGRFFTFPGDAGQRRDIVSRMKVLKPQQEGFF